MNSKEISKKTAQLLLKIKAIQIRPEKPFKFTSGILSPIYIDNRILMSLPKERRKIINFYLKIIKEKIGVTKNTIFSGTATAAIFQTAYISQKLNLPMVYVRDTKKGHGGQNQIEGIVKKGQRAVVIEDHISTGGSLIGNLRALRKAGAKVNYAIATTTYLMKKASILFKKAKIKVYTLTDLKTIIDEAVKGKYIKASDKDLVLKWAENPPSWGKKFGFEK
ncbi:orotate phosphoribosyltransferase [Candidatus Beckwithbacteria bacterium CG10_big_fil_rev_8_21_14_0_10_34_10]|uniref:Orotate phosphoribosyltransferase n=1 Tax=Candidatus Beckwithbacteria bacterium CG10_big_fil_rev_8_21_14_0_10_34_10 TaxID=1974495 RepID=A0A2H0WCF1_9BACT|nr:MAG: orotate phosphoribosyltransferase [Candidatus Beckwithbacteria bacterium CG10_big_fil_rev_8_21_14_0_10_34_10]